MSKRTPGLPRIDRDLYETPADAVEPLLPFLAPATRFVEPCAGSGLMVGHLERQGHWCVAASDIHPLNHDIGTLDALALPRPPAGCAIITNPPWKRDLLHKMIVHFSDLAPTWLLFDADWAHTKTTAPPYLRRCRRIVSVGRVKWVFEGSKTAGFDNVAWYEFGEPRVGSVPLFFGHGMRPDDLGSRPRRICPDCGVLIDRFGKWHLQDRNGVPTPVHRDCEYPSGVGIELDTSLLEWGGLTSESAG